MLRIRILGLLYVCVLLALVLPCSAINEAALPICSQLTGIVKDRYIFFISAGPTMAEDAGIVLTAFTGLGEEHSPINIQASYTTPMGSQMVLSEGNVAVVPSIANSEIKVELSSTTGTSEPFTFLSYYANYPSCFIPVSPLFPFRATIPSSVKTVNGKFVPAFVYLSTTVPNESNAVKITVKGSPAPAASVFVIRGPGSGPGIPAHEIYKSGDIIGSPPGAFNFAYVPGVTEPTGVELFQVEIAVEFTTSKRPASPQQTQGPTERHDKEREGGSFLFSLVRIALIVFILWFLATGYYNYTSQGIRNFPFMFPFGSSIAGLLVRFGLANVSRADYSDIESTRI